MLDADMKDKIEFLAAVSVSIRFMTGKTPDVIRHEAIKVASKALTKHGGYDMDDYEQEEYIEELRRAIDRTLAAVDGGTLNPATIVRIIPGNPLLD